MSEEKAPRASGASVILEDKCVTKRSTAELMAIEVEKTRAARDIGSTTRLFRVPRVLEHEPGSDTAGFEFIPDLVNFRQVVFSSGRAEEFGTRLGRIVAAVHTSLKLPDALRRPLPAPYGTSGESVFIHGDLSLGNFAYIRSTDEIVLLDWQTTHFFEARSTVGSRYFDLAWLVRNLYLRPPVHVLLRDTITPVLRKLLAAYADDSSGLFVPAEFHECLIGMAGDRDGEIMSGSSWPLRLCQRNSRARAWRFLDRLAGETGMPQ